MTPTPEDLFPQTAVTVKQAADAALLETLSAFAGGLEMKPQSQVRCVVVSENGAFQLCRSYTRAKEWGAAQNEAYAIFHVSHGRTFDLPEAELKRRVADLLGSTEGGDTDEGEGS